MSEYVSGEDVAEALIAAKVTRASQMGVTSRMFVAAVSFGVRRDTLDRWLGVARMRHLDLEQRREFARSRRAWVTS